MRIQGLLKKGGEWPEVMSIVAGRIVPSEMPVTPLLRQIDHLQSTLRVLSTY